jgi:endonuclease/exonuclease/phosphatase family metal-dependent hydrolase
MIKLVSINIQADMNHETVLPFLLKENADVVCIQEIYIHDLEMYEKVLGMKSFFKPMDMRESFKHKDGNTTLLFGPAIFTANDAQFSYQYIYGDETHIPVFLAKNESMTERSLVSNIVLIWGDITIPHDATYRISTTHFTWTPEGLPTPYQIEDAKILIQTLDEKLKDFVLVGDLNAPRGMETFGMLAKKYTDNIPPEYDSSLDPKLHRVAGLKHMVDGLFSTKEYNVSNVQLIEGVSDHKAVIAMVDKMK